MATQSQAEPQAQTIPPQSTAAADAAADAADQKREQKRNSELLDQIVSSGAVGERDRIILARADLDYKQRLAKMFANSGCFADIDKDADGKYLPEAMSIARAVVKIELGNSMGFSAAESMTGIDIIKGRVAVGANLRAARMQRAGFSWPGMICRDDGCWIPLEFHGKPMLQQKVSEAGDLVFDDKGKPVMVQVVVSFTKKDAERAGLGSKDNYKKDPSSMYFARAITRTQRRYGPGVLGVDILDTYEAQDLSNAPERERAALSLDLLKVSTDENRGHDATAAPKEEPPASTAPQPQETPTATEEPTTGTPSSVAPEGSKPPKKAKPPKTLYDYQDWERAQESVDWEKEFIKVAGKVYHIPEGEANYKEFKG